MTTETQGRRRLRTGADGHPGPEALAGSHLDRRRRRMLAVLLVGQGMAVMDASIVNVAMPDISRDLGASGAVLQMVIGGYTLTYAVLLVIGARLGGDHGHGRVFVGGLVAFTLASLACGLAPRGEALVAARLVQGVAAAAMIPQVLSVIQRELTGRERARALGWYGAVLSGGIVVGQVLGGALVSADIAGIGWRAVFGVNVPIGVALAVPAARLLTLRRPTPTTGRPPAVDWWGVGTLTAAMAALVLPLVLGRENGWPLWTWLSLVGGAVLLMVFVVVERSVAARGVPLLDLGVLGVPAVRAGLVGLFVAMATWGGFQFAFTLFLQGSVGLSPLGSGLTFVPAGICFALASTRVDRLPERWQRWTPTAGFALAVPMYVMIALIAHTGWSVWTTIPLMALSGLGFGAAVSPLVGQTVARVSAAQAPAASGLVTTATQLAIVVGVATIGTLYLDRAAAAGAEQAILVTMLVEAGLIIFAGVSSFLLARAAGR